MDNSSLRILLVEDNLGDVRLLEEALREMGGPPMGLIHAGRLDEGLRQIERQPVDIVLLDLSLPDASGLTTLQRMAKAAPSIPIIVLTGLKSEEFALTAMREGAEDYLIKGQIDGNLLLRSIRYAIERHRLTQERQQAEAALRKAYEELESRVQERTGELQRANLALLAEAEERRQAEAALARARDEALASARLKAEFLANMSHEIRTPMNGVIGMANLLLKAELTRQQREYVEAIRNSADALLKIINDILDFSKIEAGKLSFEVVTFDFREVVESTLGLLAERAQAKGLELSGFIDPQVTVKLRGDPVRLRQVLTNLVSNAIKFTECGDVSVRVGCDSETAEAVRLRIEVRDTGIGISPEAQERLFRAFSQADGSMSRKYGGTGLGLAISKQLVEMMDGLIGVESKLREGSTFWFTVKLAKTPGSAPSTAPALPEIAGARILVVEDSPVHGEHLILQLRHWNTRPALTESGEAALAALREAAASGDRFILALVDLGMIEMDGLKLARTIKSDPAIGATRLILMTPLMHRISVEEMKQAGLSGCLVKPIKLARLRQCLGEFARKLAPDTQRLAAVPSPLRQTRSPQLASARKPRILLAEDNVINQQVALGQLHEFGLEAEVVANGVQVLETLERTHFDIILMDCQMPDLDGYETARRIRSWQRAEPSAPVIRIIAMTAHAMEGDREKCLAAGMDDYLSKPVREEELQAALERWRPPGQGNEPPPLASPKPGRASEASRAAPEQELEPASSEPPLDLTRLRRVTSRDPKKLRELAALYWEQIESLLAGLVKASQQAAPQEVEHLAHQGLGASAACGMTAIVSSFRELERMGREGELSQAAGVLDEAKHQLERMKQFLEKSLDETAALPEIK